MPKSRLKKSSLSLKRISEGSASKNLKVTIYRKVSYCKQNHFVRYYLKNNNFKDHKDKESHKHFSKKKKKDNVNTEPEFTSIKESAIEVVPTFLGLPLEVSPPPSPTYSCEADSRFDCYDFPMSWDENETIVPFKTGKKRKTPVLDSVSDFEDFKWSPLSKRKTGANFVNKTLELKNPEKKLHEKECKWCLKLFYTKKSENIFCKKCYKLKDDDNTDEKESKKVKWKIINTKFECGKNKLKSSKETNCGSKSSRNDKKARKKEKAKTSSDKKMIKSSETNCDIVISQKDTNVKKTVKSKSKAAMKIVGGKKLSNKDTNAKTVESTFKATPKIVGKKKRKKSLKSTCDSLGSQKDCDAAGILNGIPEDNCDIVSSEDLTDSPIQFAKIKRTWGNAVNVEKILSGIYQLTFPLDDIDIDYESVDVLKAEVETSAEEPKVPQTRVSNILLPYNVSRTKNDEQLQNSVSKTVINAKEELEAISLLAYLDMDNDIHHCLSNLYKSEYKKYRQMKRNRGLPGNRDKHAQFKKVVRFQQRKLKTLTMANTLLQTHGSYTKIAETIMSQIPSDSISPNNEYIALPCNLSCDMHDTSQEQLKSTIPESLTFPTTEVNIEKFRCNTHNVSDNLEIKCSIGNLETAQSSTIFTLPCSTPQPVIEASSFPDNTGNIRKRKIKRNHGLPGYRDRDAHFENALFKKVARFQQRKSETLTGTNMPLQTNGSYTKLAETMMGHIPSEIIGDSISPNNEYIALPCDLNCDMHTSQEQLKSIISEHLTFPAAEVNIEKSRCNSHNLSDTLEIKYNIGNLESAKSSMIFALPCSTPQPVTEVSSFPDNIEASNIPDNIEASNIPDNIEASNIPDNIEASFVPMNVGAERFETSYSLPESISSLLPAAQPFAPQCSHEVNESRYTPSTGSGSGMPSRPESARLKLEEHQGAPFGATQDNMTHSTENCIAGEDCQTSSPASCRLSQSEYNQEELLRNVQSLLNYSQDIRLSQNAIALKIHNHLSLQPATALLYEMNRQQNHRLTHLPLNQSLPGFETFTCREQFFSHVYEQMQNTALTPPHQQMSTSSISTYPQHFSTLSNHVENLTQDYILPPVQSFATQSHPWQHFQSMVPDVPSFGTLQYNFPYNMESIPTDVVIDNRHFLNSPSCFPPPNHQQTDLEASTSYNVLEPYTSMQYNKQAKSLENTQTSAVNVDSTPRILNVYSTTSGGSCRVGTPSGENFKAFKAQTQDKKKPKKTRKFTKKEKTIKNLIQS